MINEHLPSQLGTDQTPFQPGSTPDGSVRVETTQSYDREAAIRGLVDQMLDYSLNLQRGDEVWVRFDPTAGDITPAVVEGIEKRGASCQLSIVDDDVNRTILEALTNSVRSSLTGDSNSKEPSETDPMQEASEFLHFRTYDEIRFLARASHVVTIASRKSVPDYEVHEDLEKVFNGITRILTKIRTKKEWVLFRPPIPADVEGTGIPFEEYEALVYKACDRDWPRVKEAQAVLIEKLAKGKNLRIIVPPPPGMSEKWATDISMDIEGMVGANSIAKRNFPGSEVFLAPNIRTLADGTREGTISGRYALPYPVMFHGHILPSLILILEKGKVVEFEIFQPEGQQDVDIEKLRQHVNKILAMNDGQAAWIGEIGIGTNPVINFPVLNPLINEKGLGIHLALGNSYPNKTTEGHTAITDNGNRSDIHIDLARVMTPTYGGGQMTLDGEAFFDNGRFSDPRLDILNPAA